MKRLRAEVTHLWWRWLCIGFCYSCDRALWRWRDTDHGRRHIGGCTSQPLRSAARRAGPAPPARDRTAHAQPPTPMEP